MLFLIVIGVTAFLLSDLLEAAAIGVVVLINIAIGFGTEWRARGALQALMHLQVHEATVSRDGVDVVIDARNVVPGDVLKLEGGVAISADARVLDASDLHVNEASLTGESLPARKQQDPVGEDDPASIALADRSSMIYKGTLVTSGVGRALVTGTGAHSEIGRITELVQFIPNEPTPLERKLDVLGRRLILLTVGIAAAISLLGILQGRAVWLMIETGVALAIAAVPEGLPVVATLTQAVGIQRMARRLAFLRRLPAVESLGSTTVVCSDKTGTLTTGTMTMTRVVLDDGIFEVTGVGDSLTGEFQADGISADPDRTTRLREAVRIGASTGRASLQERDGTTVVSGDPTEAAVLVAAVKAGIDVGRLQSETQESNHVPFSSERMWSGTLRETDSGTRCFDVMGAPDRILDLSRQERTSMGDRPLSQERREWWERRNLELAEEGLRILAVAQAIHIDLEHVDAETPPPLTLVGLFALQDPPAPGARETVDTLRRAGIETVMLTGDQPRTAQSIAHSLGIEEAEVVTGPEVSRLTPAELGERMKTARVLARVSPEQKVRVVEAFQFEGHIVAMLGDGVNDAPALRKADVGVAMGGRGTDVAKETADLVLGDDRFETIGAAVEEGRVIYDNVRRFIFYLFSCNASEVAVLSLAALTTLPQPLLPLQILWLNLVTDVFPALALAMEPGEPGVMERPPRDPQSAILSGSFTRTLLSYTGLITLATLAVYLVGHFAMEAGPVLTTTMTFQTLAFSQLFHVFNARSVGRLPRTRWLQNRWVWAAIVITIALQMSAVSHAPLMRVLGTEALGLEHWSLILSASLIPLVVGQTWTRTRAS